MSGTETREVLTRFYDALSRRDGDTMAAMYSADAKFEDPVFLLEGKDIGKMWMSLMKRAKDFSASYVIAQAGDDRGVVEWTARYLFAGKNPVVNVILSEIQLKDGLIVRQKDEFDFARWAAQAMGVPGKLFGKAEWFRRTVSKKAASGLGVPAKP